MLVSDSQKLIMTSWMPIGRLASSAFGFSALSFLGAVFPMVDALVLEGRLFGHFLALDEMSPFVDRSTNALGKMSSFVDRSTLWSVLSFDESSLFLDGDPGWRPRLVTSSIVRVRDVFLLLIDFG